MGQELRQLHAAKSAQFLLFCIAPSPLGRVFIPAQKGTQWGRERQRERAESHILRACLLASPGPASSSSGISVEWDKRTRSNSSAQARKKHPQMKLKSRLFWLHQMLGATQSISQCEQHSGKARDSLTDHTDSFQREMRYCCCTSLDALSGSPQGMSSHLLQVHLLKTSNQFCGEETHLWTGI